jgi:hypothetical protein
MYQLFTMCFADRALRQDFAASLNEQFSCLPADASASSTSSTSGTVAHQQCPGSGFRAAYFQPTWSKYNGESLVAYVILPDVYVTFYADKTNSCRHLS